MKILYGIQGTGHGHISRAREIVPLLSEKAEVDVLISGYNCSMNLENVSLIKKRGISLTYDSEGSVSYLKTALNIKPVTFIKDIHTLEIEKYDLVISDFEPVTSWAGIQKNIPVVGLSHQSSFISLKSPRPNRQSLLGEQILKHFAPCTIPIGFHFKRYDSFILPPIIRQDIRNLSTEQRDHITVYLPAYDHRVLIKKFTQIPEVEWHIFSPRCEREYFEKNLIIKPVGNSSFLDSLKSSTGVITGTGFETCAEAMFLGKKLLAIPISNQYEQYCNAAALHKMGIQTLRTIDDLFVESVKDWIRITPSVQLPEIADTKKLVQFLMSLAINNKGEFTFERFVENSCIDQEIFNL